MFKLTAILGAALFLAMLIGGRDQGQVRFGLVPRQAVAASVPVASEPAQPEAAQIASVAYVPPQRVMAMPAIVAEAPKPEVVEAEAPVVVKYVGRASINVREGPGKRHGVIGRLARGEAVQVVSQDDAANGWSLIRIEGDGLEGYVATQLLVE